MTHPQPLRAVTTTLEQQTAGVPGSAGARNVAINRLMSCEIGGETIRTKKGNSGECLCYSKGLLMLLPVPNEGRPPVSQVGLYYVRTRRWERTCSAIAVPECEHVHQRAWLGLCQMTVHPGRLSRKAAAQSALLMGRQHRTNNHPHSLQTTQQNQEPPVSMTCTCLFSWRRCWTALKGPRTWESSPEPSHCTSPVHQRPIQTCK